jgi:hypothetical protein
MRGINMFKQIIIGILLSTSLLSVIETTFDEGFEFVLTLLPEKSQQLTLDSIDLFPIDKEIQDKSITSFDVNLNGDVLLCLDGGGINVYNKDGVFQNAYSFHTNNISKAKWYGITIQIYLFRDEEVIQFDPDCENITVSAVDTKKTDYKVRDSIKASVGTGEINNNNYIYKVTGNKLLEWFKQEGSTLTIIQPDGTDTVVYDASTRGILSSVLFLLLIFGFVCTIVVFLRRQLSHRDRS